MVLVCGGRRERPAGEGAAQGRTARKWQSLDPNPGSLVPQPKRCICNRAASQVRAGRSDGRSGLNCPWLKALLQPYNLPSLSFWT